MMNQQEQTLVADFEGLRDAWVKRCDLLWQHCGESPMERLAVLMSDTRAMNIHRQIAAIKEHLPKDYDWDGNV